MRLGRTTPHENGRGLEYSGASRWQETRPGYIAAIEPARRPATRMPSGTTHCRTPLSVSTRKRIASIRHPEAGGPEESPVKRQRVQELAVLHSSCCGIDVHQKSISACVLTVDGARKLTSEVRQFGTTTHELPALNDWLAQCAVTHVAMESTRRVLEADLQPPGGTGRSRAGQRGASEERARQEDRHC